jgi:hypothetical protein
VRLRGTTVALANSGRKACDDFRTQLDDVRAALHLAFSAKGDAALGAELITMATPFFIELGLCAEVQEHVRCALDSLEISGRVKVESDVHQRLLSTMSDGREHVASRPGIEVMDLLPDSV